MHFRDLMRLSFDEKSGAIDLAAIHAALPDTPEAVSAKLAAYTFWSRRVRPVPGL